jgi:hypothetical protein
MTKKEYMNYGPALFEIWFESGEFIHTRGFLHEIRGMKGITEIHDMDRDHCIYRMANA